MGIDLFALFGFVFWTKQATPIATMNEEGFLPVALNEFSRVARNESESHLLVTKYFDLPGVGGLRGNHD